ncbi:YkgJ family cysteine cluster protein [Methylogaea oryzae]|uniref:YkgJ family cysteine cluster protein n=1 Tax=Methylogaea oryzae TaxID=1295382 RepID=A0A8D4VRF5_9GAMM|nr:YkgJ family cysteine cluster protein [Methylogaea oryzae]BBL72693.1 hypothetical protein MoryE10_32990 [Methylogaea oryzae]
MEFVRRPSHRYEDPLARVWIVCAERIGFRIARSPEAYASTDGSGTVFIGSDETLDPDDSLAQMIFHELCHALVQGEDNERKPDWGLDNTRVGGDPWREHACLRLQAYLADSVGLRDFFAPTTDYRVSFWDSLPADPFYAPVEAGGRRERSCVAGRLAAWRASLPRWAGPLRDALAASAAIAAAVPREAGGEGLPSLWSTVAAPPPPHPAGHAAVAAYHAGHGCADCAWSFMERAHRRCRHAPKARLAEDAPACARWEPAAELDCLTCGACCREAYQAVEVGPREAVLKRRPDWVLKDGERHKLRREGERCAALAGGRAATESYRCEIYPDRPRTCRDFTLGSANCLDARRRVGLSL